MTTQSSDKVMAGGRVPTLDGIRGIAIGLVLLQHFADPVIHAFPHVLRTTVATICWSGWIGVDVFFVLSGFLITEILLRMKTEQDFWRSFYVKRLFRLGPVFLLFCVPVAIGMAWARTVPAVQALLLMTPIANWAMMPNGVPYLPHLWSLAVEEQFYFVWPFVVRVCKVERVRNIALWLAVGSIAAHLIGARLHVPLGILYRSTITHIAGISLGAAVAAMKSGRQPTSKLVSLAKMFIATGAGLLVVDLAVARLHYHYDGIMYLSPYLGEVAMMGTSMLTAGFVVLAVFRSLPGWAETLFSRAWLCWMGNRSYAIYIVHYILVEAYWRKAIPNFHLGAFVMLIASLLLAELSWRVLEAPALRMARRLTHHREALLIKT